MNEEKRLVEASVWVLRSGNGGTQVFGRVVDAAQGSSCKGVFGAFSSALFPSPSRSRPAAISASAPKPHARIEYSIAPRDRLRSGCGHFGHAQIVLSLRREIWRLMSAGAALLRVLAAIMVGLGGGAVGRRAASRMRGLGAFCFLSALLPLFPAPATAQAVQPSTTTTAAKAPATIEYSIFPKARALSLAQVRELATQRNTRIALAKAKLSGAQTDLKEQQNRFKINSGGGLDPFNGKVRFYLALDLERLLQLNKAERNKARQEVEAQQIGHVESTNAAIKEATVAWYGLRKSEAGVTSAIRYRDTAQALYVSADARFRAGSGELSGVLSALDGTHKANESFSATRQQVALDCLELAQSCGYATAEEMEAAL